MARYVLAPAAMSDIISILEWTQQRFGMQGRFRYEALLKQAMKDIAVEPLRIGSHVCAGISIAARIYHIGGSRNRVSAIGKVRSPRHILLYRIREDGIIEIGRVLHERMDIARHLPDEYRPDIAEDE
jgi:toxin ParE1/3/4